MIFERNRRTYESRDIVFWYARATALSPPERSLLDRHRPRLAHARMLDLGVGGGRTTRHFLPAVRDYVGVDYARGMVEACRRRFPQHRTCFSVGDARDLGHLAAGSFDFILFSFNGIDYIPHSDRARVFAEVRRLARPGGLFAFSTHNLLTVRKRLRTLSLRSLKLRLLNREWRALFEREHAHVRESHRITVYHCTPGEQLAQLAQAGFRRVRALRLSDGAEFPEGEHVLAAEDPWLYFLCET